MTDKKEMFNMLVATQSSNMEIAESLASIKDSLPEDSNISTNIASNIETQQQDVQLITKERVTDDNIPFEYLTSDGLQGVTFGNSSIQIPVDPSNIHVDEAGVVYFNVVAQQEQFMEGIDENSHKTDDLTMTSSNDLVSDSTEVVIEAMDSNLLDTVANEIDMTVTNIDDPSQLHVCPRCKAFFATSSYLKDHMKRKCIRTTTVGNQHQCGYCDLSFKQRFQLTRHMMQHTGERPYKCENCEKTFLTKSHLKRHAVVHIAKEELEYKCNRCDKAFAWSSALEAHNKSHTGERRFKCGICGRMFLHLNSLRSHMSNRHTVHGKYTCVVCKNSFDEPTDLIIHMKTHNERESVKCDRCYAFFASLKDLETHLCTNFGGKPLLCHVCKLEFPDTKEFCSHECIQMNSNRTCGCCQKVLKSLWHLREHLITHTGEKPFKCVQCLNTFRRKRELEIHMTSHGDERPFNCAHCSSTFTSDNYLKQHMRKEHREKKFICDVCHHAFMHKCSLTNHMSFHLRTGNKRFGKKHHRDDGLLIEELVKERLKNENKHAGDSTEIVALEITETRGDSIASSECTVTSAKNEACSFSSNNEMAVNAQTLCSNETNSAISKESVNPKVSDSDDFPRHVIQPSVTLRNAEQDPSNVTTIYETDSNGAMVIRCATCLQDFDCHSALLRHRKEYHNDGKPYQCDSCSRTFAIAANLSQHRNIHNIKRKYSCRHCGKSYKVTHKLREHLRILHGENTEELTDLELQLKNSSGATTEDSYTPSIDGDLLCNDEFISTNMPTNRSTTTEIYHINSADDSSSDNLTVDVVNPAMIQNIHQVTSHQTTSQSVADAKNLLSNIMFVDSTGEKSSGITPDQLSKRGDVTFLMNLSSLITELGDGIGNQRIIIQEGTQQPTEQN